MLRLLVGPLARQAFVDSLAHAWEWAGEEHVAYFFSLNLATGELQTRGRHELDPFERRWLTDSLPDLAPSHWDEEWEFGSVLRVKPKAPARAYGFRAYPGTGPDAQVIFGFRSSLDPWHYVFGKTTQYSAVLPPSLIGDKTTSEVLFAEVSTASGVSLFRTDSVYGSSYEASDTIGAGFGGLRVHVVMQPDVAASLLIGGLPQSRLPLLLLLLLVTSVLAVAAIRQLRREQELAQLRVDFVSGVSHELRTPLAQIRMFAETLELGRVRSEEERRRSLSVIVKEARRLALQVDNVLLFSSSEREAIDLNPKTVDLSALLMSFEHSFGASGFGRRLSTGARHPTGCASERRRSGVSANDLQPARQRREVRAEGPVHSATA